jgi:hypothetical protein
MYSYTYKERVYCLVSFKLLYTVKCRIKTPVHLALSPVECRVHLFTIKRIDLQASFKRSYPTASITTLLSDRQ